MGTSPDPLILLLPKIGGRVAKANGTSVADSLCRPIAYLLVFNMMVLQIGTFSQLHAVQPGILKWRPPNRGDKYIYS